MSQNVLKLKECRVCGNDKLNLVFDAGFQTLTGRFPSSTEEHITAGPLEVVQCDSAHGCDLVQLGHSYDLNEMYGESYGYRSGLNKAMVTHLKNKVEVILESFDLKQGDVVIDIGSNDGTTLNQYPAGQFDLFGVDPSSKKFGRFYDEGITKITEFFTDSVIEEHCFTSKAKVVTSFSMFYDLEDPVAFALNVERVLSEEGVWVFEQSYLPAMLTSNSFDTVCHEHLEFYSLSSVQTILKLANLRMIDVEFNDINGGSFSVTACRADASIKSNSSNINRVLAYEVSLGLSDGSAFKEFGERVHNEKLGLMDFLTEQKRLGHRVSCLGASTKGNVLLQYYGITTELVDVVGEVNADKFGCFTPGTHIPIVSQEEVLSANPDYLLVLPWHFKEFFTHSHLFKGRTLVFPLPTFELVKL